MALITPRRHVSDNKSQTVVTAGVRAITRMCRTDVSDTPRGLSPQRHASATRCRGRPNYRTTSETAAEWQLDASTRHVRGVSAHARTTCQRPHASKCRENVRK